jgi:hypothetical protein
MCRDRMTKMLIDAGVSRNGFFLSDPSPSSTPPSFVVVQRRLIGDAVLSSLANALPGKHIRSPDFRGRNATPHHNP